MGQKKPEQYFINLEKFTFETFILDYEMALLEFRCLMSHVCRCIDEGKKVSEHHLQRMRQKTVDLEKYGLQFRKRTIAMEKD